MTTPDRPLHPSSMTRFKRLIVQLMRLHWKPTSSRPTRSNSLRSLHHAIALMILLSPQLHAAQLLLDTQTYLKTNGNVKTTINFGSGFSTTPILILLPTKQGGHPANVQISSISPTSATVYPVEPRPLDGAHTSMTSVSLAIEAGSYNLAAGGPHIEAGSVDTKKTVSGDSTATQSWESVTFSEPFNNIPSVVVTIQTNNNEIGYNNSLPPVSPSAPWMTPVVKEITTTGFKVALDRSEAYNDGGSVTTEETIGYIAMQQGDGVFKDGDGNDVTWCSFDTNTFGGFDQGNAATSHSFPTSLFQAPPLAVASKTSRNTNDGGWLRLWTLTNNAIQLVIDEDSNFNISNRPLLTGQDVERDHFTDNTSQTPAVDNISVIAFSRSFTIAELPTTEPHFSLKKTVSVVSDPINGTSSTQAKAIPGSILEYALTLTNHSFGPVSNDSGSIVIADDIPDGTELVVAPTFSPSGVPCGSATTHLFQGSTSSGLSCTSGSVQYSSDGSIFSNSAGTDTKHIRITPTGAFTSFTDDTQPPPSATFKFQVKKN